MKLNVFLGNEKAGALESTENRGVIFSYDEKYLAFAALKADEKVSKIILDLISASYEKKVLIIELCT